MSTVIVGTQNVLSPPSIQRDRPPFAQYIVTYQDTVIANQNSGQVSNGWKVDFGGPNDEDLTQTNAPLAKIHVLAPSGLTLGPGYEVYGCFVAADGVTNGIAFSLAVPTIPAPTLTATPTLIGNVPAIILSGQ